MPTVGGHRVQDTTNNATVGDLVPQIMLVDSTGTAAGGLLRPSAAPALTVGATYVANDFVGTSGTPWSFTSAVRVTGGTGTLRAATLVDATAGTVACELWLFDRTITPPADSAAWSISDADALFLLGVIPFSTYYASALNSISQVLNIGMAVKANTGSTTLFGALVTRGAPAYTGTAPTITLSIEPS